MASKDQTIGALIVLVCASVAIGYVVFLFAPDLLVGLLSSVSPSLTTTTVQFWLVTIPVLIAFIAVLAIGAWIGWTMATTPPPKPFEEMEAEERPEEEKIDPAEEEGRKA